MYTTDILGENFEQMIIDLQDDYEGSVVTTLVRHKTQSTFNRGVLYIHGFNDYFFQTQLAQQYARRGVRFYAVDLRKCGRSYRKHQRESNFRDINEYFEDIDAALEIMKKEGCENILINGHSTGGLITACYAQARQQNPLFELLFLNSPFLSFNANAFEMFVLRTLSLSATIIPNASVALNTSPFYTESVHEDHYGEWDFDLNMKHLIMPKNTLSWIRGTAQAQKQIRSGLDIQQPILVMHSDHSVYEKQWSGEWLHGDTILNVDDIHKYAQHLGENVEIEVIPNGMHDLILSQENIRNEVYTKLFQWLEDQK